MQKGETGQSDWISIGIFTPKILMLSSDLEMQESNYHMHYLRKLYSYYTLNIIKIFIYYPLKGQIHIYFNGLHDIELNR